MANEWPTLMETDFRSSVHYCPFLRLEIRGGLPFSLEGALHALSLFLPLLLHGHFHFRFTLLVYLVSGA